MSSGIVKGSVNTSCQSAAQNYGNLTPNKSFVNYFTFDRQRLIHEYMPDWYVDKVLEPFSVIDGYYRGSLIRPNDSRITELFCSELSTSVKLQFLIYFYSFIYGAKLSDEQLLRNFFDSMLEQIGNFDTQLKLPFAPLAGSRPILAPNVRFSFIVYLPFFSLFFAQAIVTIRHLHRSNKSSVFIAHQAIVVTDALIMIILLNAAVPLISTYFFNSMCLSSPEFRLKPELIEDVQFRCLEAMLTLKNMFLLLFAVERWSSIYLPMRYRKRFNNNSQMIRLLMLFGVMSLGCSSLQFMSNCYDSIRQLPLFVKLPLVFVCRLLYVAATFLILFLEVLFSTSLGVRLFVLNMKSAKNVRTKAKRMNGIPLSSCVLALSTTLFNSISTLPHCVINLYSLLYELRIMNAFSFTIHWNCLVMPAVTRLYMVMVGFVAHSSSIYMFTLHYVLGKTYRAALLETLILPRLFRFTGMKICSTRKLVAQKIEANIGVFSNLHRRTTAVQPLSGHFNMVNMCNTKRT